VTSNPYPAAGSYPAIGSGASNTMFIKCVTPGDFVLGFDDGVSTAYGSQLLTTLRNEGVVATFFVNGYNWNDLDSDVNAANMLKSIRDAGHQIASHTFEHLDLQTLTTDELWAQVRRNDVAITNVLGRSFSPKFIRAPFGSVNTNVLRALESWGYTVVWNNIKNRDTDHAFGTDAEQLSWDISNYTSTLAASNVNVNSFISLNHEQIKVTSQSFIGQIIPIIRNYGYRFVSLGQCLNPSNPNDWYRTLP